MRSRSRRHTESLITRERGGDLYLISMFCFCYLIFHSFIDLTTSRSCRFQFDFCFSSVLFRSVKHSCLNLEKHRLKSVHLIYVGILYQKLRHLQRPMQILPKFSNDTILFFFKKSSIHRLIIVLSINFSLIFKNNLVQTNTNLLFHHNSVKLRTKNV